MASSRVVLSPLGWSVIVGGMGALLIGLVTLNLLLLILPIAVLALATTELLAFDWTTRDFGPSWFRWQRFENSSQVRIDGVGSMAIDLEMVGPGPIYAEVFDPQPDGFEVVLGSPRLLTWWSASSPVRLAYVYRPRQRGQFRVGPTIVIAHDPLGFGFRTAKLENRWEVLVTPALSVQEASTVVPLGPRGPSEAFRRRVGAGTEFHSLREYQSSDDVRKIAWRRSGLDKIYVREQEEEAHPEILILLDTSRDMRLGPPGKEALEQAVEGGAVLAGQAIRGHDRVGLLVFSDRVSEFVPPQRGSEGALVLTEAFGRIRLAPTPFDLAQALTLAQERLTVPTTIVLFSTLLSLSGPLEGPVGALRTRGHRLVAVCPQVGTLFPPAADPVAARTLQFALAPVQRQVDLGVERLRAVGVPVLTYAAPEVREATLELHAWTRSWGELG
ncbi:MAG TPA: DUF58 domain-containing protein [Thermoplasmata archaeon]|nr:DUF58 domain-containing protein [Thermoplasmata archaeon]